MFNHCVSQGITLFDTGDSYGTGRLNGRSETLLGQFADAYSGPNQENICIATKLAAYPWRLTRGSIVKSLRRVRETVGATGGPGPNALVYRQLRPLAGRPISGWPDGSLRTGPGEGRRAFQLWAETAEVVITSDSASGAFPIATLQVQYSLVSTYPVTGVGN